MEGESLVHSPQPLGQAGTRVNTVDIVCSHYGDGEAGLVTSVKAGEPSKRLLT